MNQNHDIAKTTARFGRWTGTVHWHPLLAAEFPADEDRQAIIALFDEAMCACNTVVFYLNHTAYKDKEIVWSSTADDKANEIQIEASLSRRPELFDGHDPEWMAALIEELEWFDETFSKTGRPFPDTLEKFREEFHQWKANKEAGR